MLTRSEAIQKFGTEKWHPNQGTILISKSLGTIRTILELDEIWFKRFHVTDQSICGSFFSLLNCTLKKGQNNEFPHCFLLHFIRIKSQRTCIVNIFLNPNISKGPTIFSRWVLPLLRFIELGRSLYPGSRHAAI